MVFGKKLFLQVCGVKRIEKSCSQYFSFFFVRNYKNFKILVIKIQLNSQIYLDEKMAHLFPVDARFRTGHGLKFPARAGPGFLTLSPGRAGLSPRAGPAAEPAAFNGLFKGGPKNI